MTKEQEFLLRLCSTFFGGEVDEVPEGLDFDALLAEARQQTVAGLVFEKVWPFMKGSQAGQAWKMQYVRELQNSSIIFAAHNQVHELFTKENIPYVVLKGCASAHYYSKPENRTMGDVDVLVKDEDEKRAVELMVSQGFVAKEKSEKSVHTELLKEDFHVEIHNAFIRLEDQNIQKTVDEYLSDVIERAEPVTEGEEQKTTFRMPQPFHHGLIITLHTIKHHLKGSGTGLRHLMDLAFFYDSFSDEEFEKLFKEKFKAIGIWKFTEIMKGLCNYCLFARDNEEISQEDEEFYGAILEDIFDGGNFARKDALNRNAGLRIISEASEKDKKTGIIGIIKATNKVGGSVFPFMGENPFLKHVAWIPYGFRYIYRVATKKARFVNPVTAFDTAKDRENLKGRFKLFDPE